MTIQIVDPLLDCGPICQSAAEPAIVDIRHSTTGGLLFDGPLRLPFCANEQDCAALGDQIAHQFVIFIDTRHRLVQVNDVDSAAFGEDILPHFWIPAPGPVPEMYACLQ